MFWLDLLNVQQSSMRADFFEKKNIVLLAFSYFIINFIMLYSQ